MIKYGIKGLIVKDPWATKILAGEKTIEIRGMSTKIRGKIAIIKSGTKMAFGTVEVINSVELDKESFNRLREFHKLDCNFEDIKYKKIYGWVLKNPKIFNKPVKVIQPKGCIIWVNI